MSENTTSEQESKSTQKRTGGFPTVSLPIAVGMMKVVWEKEKRNPAPATAIMSHWNYAPKSSGGFQALASLKRFGLLEEVAGATPRSLKVSQMAQDLLKYENTDPIAYRKQLKFMALLPDFNQEMWNKYGHELPSDKTVETYLIFDRHLSDGAAKQFLRLYKETISFAKLTEGDSIEETPVVDLDVVPPVNPPKGAKPMVSPINANELAVPIADGMVARVPYPMAEEDFALLIETLELWKKKLIKKTEVDKIIEAKVRDPKDRKTAKDLTEV
ncbi:MAG: hypothetical protein ABSD77_08800 [Verrucomicrobiota bacterium]|jgi:hypothetical protein